MRPAVCIEVPLNPVITRAAGEYLMLVIACSVVARPAPDHAHALAAVLTGWIMCPDAWAHRQSISRPRGFSRGSPTILPNEFGVCHDILL